MVDLSGKLLEKTETAIRIYDHWQAHLKVPKHLILHFIKKLLVPSVSYGAFTDSSTSKYVYE